MSASPEPLRPTPIGDEYPRGGLDPFDLAEARTQLLYDGRGMSRAWVHGVDHGDERSAYEAIPMGYRALIELEKRAVVAGGVVLREWPQSDASDAAFRRMVDNGWLGPISPDAYRLRPQFGSSGNETRPDYPSALVRAVELSADGSAWMVARVLAHESWH